MIIDCKECEMYQSEHCNDCFVMAVLSRRDDDLIEIDDDEEQAISNLQEAGLAPLLKFRKRAG